MKKKLGKQKEKHIAHIKSKEFYSYFATMFFKGHDKQRNRVLIDYDSAYYLDYVTYNKVIRRFNELVRDEVLYNAFDFILPARMGIMCIRKSKVEPWLDASGKLVNPLPVDWGKTNKLWATNPEAKAKKTLIHFRNEHSNGYIGKWRLNNSTATYKWKSAYSFIPTRTAKQKLGKIFLDEESTSDFYTK